MNPSDTPQKKKTPRHGDSYLPDIHRLLPQSSDAEMGVLASILIGGPDILDTLQLPSEAFHIPAHATIYDQIVAMRNERKPIDLITLSETLRDRQLLDECGGPAFIADIFTFLPTAANATYYAEILREKITLRALIRVCTDIAARAYSEQDNVTGLVDEAGTRLIDIAAGFFREETIAHIKHATFAAIDEIEYAYRNRGRTVGIPTGYPDLDRMIGGWQKGFTYYFGARPAMGKTSLGMNFAIHAGSAAAEIRCPVLFFSVEMTAVQLAKRAIFTIAERNQQRARDGFLSEADFPRLAAAAGELGNGNIYVDETAALTIADFRARARRWIKKIRRTHGERKDGKPDGMIWIDYLQRMKGSSKRAEDARYLELQEIAQGISQTAKELQIPIGILAQLKRPKDKKPDTEPDMTEFRECGDIEQEAHVVALIHRPHYYVKGSEEKQRDLAERMAEARGENFTVEDLARYAKLIIDKQREGPVGSVDLKFIGDYTKFETWDPKRKRYSNNPEERQDTGGEG